MLLRLLGSGRGRLPSRAVFSVAGMLLAMLGALGLVGARLLFSGVPLARDLTEHAFFYFYQLLGASLAFGVFGFLIGMRVDALRRRRDWYREKADRDDLTGLLAPTAFRRALEGLAEDARQHFETLAILLLGVEGLSGSESERGAATTRAVLLHLASVARKIGGSEAVVGRWGGMEIALLLRNTNYPAAKEVAASLRDAAAERPVMAAGGRTFWIPSIGGVAGSPSASGDVLLRRAQEALQEALRTEGRIVLREA